MEVWIETTIHETDDKCLAAFVKMKDRKEPGKVSRYHIFDLTRQGRGCYLWVKVNQDQHSDIDLMKELYVKTIDEWNSFRDGYIAREENDARPKS